MSLLYDPMYKNRVDYHATSEYNKGYAKGLEEAQVRFDIALNKAQKIVDVKFNPPATIIFWADGEKTVVKCQDGDEFDPEKGFAMAYCKKMMGNKGRYFQNVKKWTEKYEAPKKSPLEMMDSKDIPSVTNDWKGFLKKHRDELLEKVVKIEDLPADDDWFSEENKI